jgi:hypothetical protein
MPAGDAQMDWKRISLSMDEMRAIKHEVLRGRPFVDRVSFALALNMARMYQERGDFFQVLNELDFMERYLETPSKRRVSSTKPATRFVTRPLDRFWHKHFSSARHIVHNIGATWGINRGGAGNQSLDAMLRQVAEECGDDPTMWKNVLSYRFVVEGYVARAQCRPRQREGRVTGDWILFAKHAGENYYLALANHADGDEPERLYTQLVQSCAAEFPFLFE